MKLTRRILATLVFFTITYSSMAQHMKFMGIAIDGRVENLLPKLLQKGMKLESYSTPTSKTLSGQFFGEDAEVTVAFDRDTHIVHDITVSILKNYAIENYNIQKRFLEEVESKYTYKKDVKRSEISDQPHYEYYIFENNELVGMIICELVIIDDLSMLTIDYKDVDNYLATEKKKRDDI
ncbi:MAG: hypothetical protein KBT39_04705 [Bacteroidales bacterium]|nr:hypothetical protein [Bacteroidales bacterium]